ncbi:MAG: hypothetical protein Roseis2KO_07710 [Roseivirga sp.]
MLPAVLGSLGWKHFSLDARLCCLLIWFIFLNGAIAFVWELVYGPNMPFFHLYILVEGVLLMRIFASLLNPFIARKAVYAAAVIFVIIWTINVLFFDGITGYPTYILAIKGITLIILAVSWFAKVLREKKILHPEKLFAFWLSTGVLIFFSGNMLLFIFSNFIFTSQRHVYLAIWGTHAILVILLYILYTIAFIWARKNPTSS